jgi:O-antigen/teichoic acid export membrane protein
VVIFQFVSLRSSAASKAFVVGLGYAISQGVVLLATPWLARLHEVAEFGVLANLTSVANIAVAVGALRLDQAMLVADSDDEAMGLRDCSLVLALVWGFLSIPVSAFSGAWAQPWATSVLTVGLTTFLATATQTVAMALLRDGRVRAVGLLRASQGILFVALAFTTGCSLSVCFALSWSAGAMVFLSWRGKPPRFKPLAALVSQYRQFSLLGSFGSILDVLGFSMLVWVLSSGYGLAECGRVTQVQRVVGAPVMLLALPLSQLLQRKWAQELGAGRDGLSSSFHQAFRWLVALAVLWIATILMFGPAIVRGVLGAGWAEDRWEIAALSIAVCARGIVSPLSGLLVVKRAFSHAVGWQAAYLATVLVALPLASNHLDLRNFIFTFVALDVLMYATYFAIISRSLR